MSIRDDLSALVQLQQRELELIRIESEIKAVEQRRAALQAQIADAEAEVEKAEQDAEKARAEAKRLDLDLKSAEEKVSKYKDQMHSVKTNEQLWALQEEIGHAEKDVGDIEDRILDQLEVADSLDAEIEQRQGELTEERQRVDKEVAVADERERGLQADRAEVEAAIAELVERVPDDLRKKYEGLKSLRGGIGVAEILDEVCLVCNTKVRPQLYVDTLNFRDVKQCENCKRIIYVAERLDLKPVAAAPAEGGAGSAAEVAP